MGQGDDGGSPQLPIGVMIFASSRKAACAFCKCCSGSGILRPRQGAVPRTSFAQLGGASSLPRCWLAGYSKRLGGLAPTGKTSAGTAVPAIDVSATSLGV